MRFELCKADHSDENVCFICDDSLRFSYFNQPPPSRYYDEKKLADPYRVFLVASDFGDQPTGAHTFYEANRIAHSRYFQEHVYWRQWKYQTRRSRKKPVRKGQSECPTCSGSEEDTITSIWAKHPLFPCWVALDRNGRAVRVFEHSFETLQEREQVDDVRAADQIAFEAAPPSAKDGFARDAIYQSYIDVVSSEFWLRFNAARQHYDSAGGWPFSWIPWR